jgi:hypothetical protein
MRAPHVEGSRGVGTALLPFSLHATAMLHGSPPASPEYGMGRMCGARCGVNWGWDGGCNQEGSFVASWKATPSLLHDTPQTSFFRKALVGLNASQGLSGAPAPPLPPPNRSTTPHTLIVIKGKFGEKGHLSEHIPTRPLTTKVLSQLKVHHEATSGNLHLACICRTGSHLCSRKHVDKGKKIPTQIPEGPPHEDARGSQGDPSTLGFDAW